MTDEEAILKTESAGYAAIQAADADLLRQILARDFVATTSEGATLHRDEWIAAVTAAARHGISLRPHTPVVTVGEGRAIVHRDVSVESPLGLRRISYVTVYELRDGQWTIVLNSSRAIPPPIAE